MIRAAIILLALLPIAAQAKPAPQVRVDRFNGDRYVSMAQGATANEVANAIKQKRKSRKPTIKRKPKPGHVSPLTLAQGGRPRAWCGWWLDHHLGLHDRKLWLARNWASVGSNAGGPRIGAIVVWRHHVGIITGQVGGKWIVKSGNDGHAVRERPRSITGAIAFRYAGRAS